MFKITNIYITALILPFSFCVGKRKNYISEWDAGHGGHSHGMEVEVREEAESPPDTTALLVNNTPTYPVTGNILRSV